MNATIKKGFLIAEYDFESFNKIVHFLIEDNNFITCMALGVKKIESKNARHLFSGHQLEIEFFQSHLQNKISKLKKVTLLEKFLPERLKNNALFLLNKIMQRISSNNFDNENLFNDYQIFLNQINENYDEEFIMCWILIWAQKKFGLILNFKSCTICKSKNNISSLSLKSLGILCSHCCLETHDVTWTKNGLMLFYYLSYQNIEKAKDYQSGSKILLNFLIQIYDNVLGIKV